MCGATQLNLTSRYHFLQEEDLEQLRMGYTASSENKIAAHLVHDYLLYTILTEKEPRFQEVSVPCKFFLPKQNRPKLTNQCI